MSNKTVLDAKNMLVVQLGVTEAEADLLLPLYQRGNMTAGGLSLVVNQPVSKVKRALKRLEKKGLVYEIEGIVPTYRALSPGLATGPVLLNLSTQLKSLDGEITESINDITTRIDATMTDVLNEHASITASVRDDLTTLEASLLEMVTKHLDATATTASELIEKVTQRIGDVLSKLSHDVDTELGESLTALQKELDKNQKKLMNDTTKALDDFTNWLENEHKASLEHLKEFQDKAGHLIDKARTLISDSFAQSSAAVHETLQSLSSSLGEGSNEYITKLRMIIEGLDDDMNEARVQLFNGLMSTFETTRTALDELLQQSQMISDEETDQLRDGMNQFIETSRGVLDEINNWKQDADASIENFSRVISNQVEQIAKIDQSFVDTLGTTLTGYMDRINSFLQDQYDTFDSHLSEIDDEYSQSLKQAKASLLRDIETEAEKENILLHKSIEKLHADLSDLSTAAVNDLVLKLTQSGEEMINMIMQNTEQLNGVSKRFVEQIQSTVNDVISKNSASSSSLITTVMQTNESFEAKIDMKIADVISQFQTIATQYSLETQSLYQELNSQIDDKLEGAIKSITSHMNGAKKQIEKVVNQQLARIDEQSTSITDSIHAELENITNQLINLIQSAESALLGLVTGRMAETRELVNSIRTEFNVAIKNESKLLKRHIKELKQKYMVDMDQQLKVLQETSESLSADLAEFAQTQKQEFGVLLKDAKVDFETAMHASQNVMNELQNVTVKKMGDSLNQALGEFANITESTKFNMSERIGIITDSSKEHLEHTIQHILATLESVHLEQSEIRNRMVSEAAKQLDTSMAELTQSLAEHLETISTSLAEGKKKQDGLQTAIRSELSKILDDRRKETTLTISGATMALRNANNNLHSQIASVHSKLANELTTVVNNLSETSQNIVATVAERRDASIEQIHTLHKNHLDRLQSLYSEHEQNFMNIRKETLGRVKESLDEIPAEFHHEVEQSIEASLTELTNSHDRLKSELSVEVLDIEMATESTVNEITTILNNLRENVLRTQNDSIQLVHKAANLATQAMVGRFESIGVGLKSDLNNHYQEILEEFRSGVTESKNAIDEFGNQLTNTAASSIAEFKQQHGLALNTLEEQTDKTIRNWAIEQKKNTETLQHKILAASQTIRDASLAAINSLDAIRAAIAALEPMVLEKSWHLAGIEEIRAQIVDMAKQANETIVVAVPSLDMLDIGKLGKIKGTASKVLIVPYTDELDPSLDHMRGWTIWQTRTPVLLAVMDDSQILVSGSAADEPPVALISTDPAYLQLYRELIGPHLIEGRVKPS